jgi:aspartate kinase
MWGRLLGLNAGLVRRYPVASATGRPERLADGPESPPPAATGFSEIGLPLVVQKFGGSSVATSERIMAAARRAIRAQQAGNQVVVVVSARGDTTDELIALAREITEFPPAREMDMLLSTGEQISIALMAMAIQSLGHPAVSLTGAQVGIVTDAFHTKARIKSISTERLRHALNAGQIVIVAGFQGIDEQDNITTLGRGGSDTTAVALAAVTDADVCEIYTDVDGVYTTDPRIVPEARKIGRISYDEMLELASVGAGVMHSRSIEFSKKFDVPIHVRSSFSDAAGTWIVAETPEMENVVVCGAALVKDEARVTLWGVPDQPGAIHRIFTRIAQHNVVVDMIVQNVSTDGRTQVSFTVLRGDLHETLQVARDVACEIGAGGVHHEDNVSKLSVVGVGMRTHSGVADRMFAALAARDINIKMITTSEIKISVLVDRDRAAEALRAVHQAFRLHEAACDSGQPAGEFVKKHAAMAMADRASSLAAVVQQLPTLEAIVVSDVALSEDQARITAIGVPDQPGIAAQIFARVARAGAIVDMIVQNVSTEGLAHVSFTVPRAGLDAVVHEAQVVARDLGGSVTVDPNIAKITLMGVGMRTHTGVAAKMFGALTEPDIKVHMINTSEVHITAVVELARAHQAVSQLRRALGLAN